MNRERQKAKIRDAEMRLGIGPKQLAAEIGAPYPTFKDWKSGRRPMPGVAVRCLELLQTVRAAGFET